ncbi:MAG: tRNA lysidine(34) synthetase TilS, partial [Paracoccaceae bacterium]
RRAVRFLGGDILIDRAEFDAAAQETRARLLAHALCWVASADYRPRFSALGRALADCGAGKRCTLHGCLIMPRKGALHVTREAAVVAKAESATGALWDGRWRLVGPDGAAVDGAGAGGAELTVRALGAAGLAQLPPGAAPKDLPQAALLAQPAVWRGAELIAAPLAGWPNGWQANAARTAEDFHRLLIVH